MFSKTLLLGLLAMPFTLGIVDGPPSHPLKSSRILSTENQAVLRSGESPSMPIYKTMKSGNISRSYLLQIPSDYDENTSKKWPLIVDFHGRNGSSEGQRDNSQYYLNPSGKEYFVAYPMGCLGSGSKGGPPEPAWQGAPYANASCDDLLFTSQLVNLTLASYNIDSKRIYASGKSNGGGFVGTLACSPTGDIFAAFAMASAALYTDTFNSPENCAGQRPRRILEAHGTDDTVIPINGRKDGSTPNIARWTGRWAERNGCVPHRDRSTTSTDWGTITSYSCKGYLNFIQQYSVDGLGHCWPSLVDNTDATKQPDSCFVPSLDYTQAVLDFFAS